MADKLWSILHDTSDGIEYVIKGTLIVLIVLSAPLWAPFWVIGRYFAGECRE